MVNDKEHLQEPTATPSKETTQVLTEITDSILSIDTSDHHLNPIDGNYFYYVEVMDSILDNNNNEDTDVKWYDAENDIVPKNVDKFCFDNSRVIMVPLHTSFYPYLHPA